MSLAPADNDVFGNLINGVISQGARALGSTLYSFGDNALNPAYIPPEQASARANPAILDGGASGGFLAGLGGYAPILLIGGALLVVILLVKRG